MNERTMPKVLGAFSMALVFVILPILLGMAWPAAKMFFGAVAVLGLITWLMGLYALLIGTLRE